MCRKIFFILFSVLLPCVCMAAGGGVFPDGGPIPEWFNDTSRVDVDTLGTK